MSGLEIERNEDTATLDVIINNNNGFSFASFSLANINRYSLLLILSKKENLFIQKPQKQSQVYTAAMLNGT